MNYVIQAALSNTQHPECGQVTISFPIPIGQYNKTIAMLQAIDLDFSVNRDCKVDEINSRYRVLNSIQGTLVNVDNLDYLAKRLDGFCSGEVSQFEAMAHKLKLSDVKDFIDLTFCCQQATVITDFSDLETVGRNYFMALNRDIPGAEGLEPMDVDGSEIALQLIAEGGGVVTPYGVVYDNGMVLKQVYNKRQFALYPYDGILMVLEIMPKQGLAEGENPEHLNLPASEHQIEQTLLRIGIAAPCDAQVCVVWNELPEKVADTLDLDHLSGSDLPALNRMSWAVGPLLDSDMEKLNAVALMAGPRNAGEICELAENLDQFEFIPDIQTAEEYGWYMIQLSGRIEIDENLEEFYDYKQYGEQQIQQEGGQFNEYGYVAYLGTIPLEELIKDTHAESNWQGPQMGGQLC